MERWAYSVLLMALIGLFGAGQVLGASPDQNKQQPTSKTVEWGKSTKTKDSSGSKSSISDKAGKQAQKMNEKSKTPTASSTGKKTSTVSSSSDQKKPEITASKKSSPGSNSSDRKDRETGKKSSSGLSSAAQKNQGATGGASSSTASHKEKLGSSASHNAGREMDRQHYNQKIKESDQKISALQKRIQESKQRENNLNSEYRKTDQAIIANHGPGAIGEEAGTKSYNTQRSQERGKAALTGPGPALTESRDTWSKNVDAERKTREGLERDLKNAQSDKEGYQRKLRDLK